jgi:hypothetical protein
MQGVTVEYHRPTIHAAICSAATVISTQTISAWMVMAFPSPVSDRQYNQASIANH